MAAACDSVRVPFALPAVLLALGLELVPVRIVYDAPAECPTAQELYDAVRARTDHVRPAIAEEPHLDVAVRVTQTARGYAGEVREVVNGKESAVRAMDGGTCKEVVEALSLTVALSIDPDAHSPTPPPAPVSVPRSMPTLPTPAPPRGAVVTPLQLEIGLGALLSSVDDHAGGVGGRLSAGLHRQVDPRISRSLELALSFVSSGLPAAPSDHRARLGALTLAVCPWQYRWHDLDLAPCALGMFGVLEVTGKGIPDAKTVDRAWWSAGLDARVKWLLGQGWFVEDAFGATVPLVRRRFYTSDAAHVVAETPAVAVFMRLGLGFRF